MTKRQEEIKAEMKQKTKELDELDNLILDELLIQVTKQKRVYDIIGGVLMMVTIVLVFVGSIGMAIISSLLTTLALISASTISNKKVILLKEKQENELERFLIK